MTDHEKTAVWLRNQHELHLALSVLDCVIRDKRGWLSDVLVWFDPAKFMVDPFFGGVVRSLVELIESGEPVTALEIAKRLNDERAFNESMQWIRQLSDRCTSQAGHLQFYARQVYDDYRKRTASAEAHETANRLEGSREPDTELEELSAIPGRFSPPDIDRTQHIKTAIQDAMAELDSTEPTGMQIGIPAVDSILGGIADTAHVVVTAETSCGKSVLLGQTAIKVAAQDGKAVVFFALEMNEKEMAKRWASWLAKQPQNGGDRRALIGGFGRVRELTHAEHLLHIICDVPSIEAIERKSEAIAATMPVGAIFVDYLQQVPGSRKACTREEEVSGVSRRLKQLAMRLKVPVFAACQVSRASGGAPSMRNIRESGAIEQNADVVLIVDPEQRPERHGDKRTVDLKISVSKNRNGPTGLAENLRWDGHLYRMRESDAYEMDNYDSDLRFQ